MLRPINVPVTWPRVNDDVCGTFLITGVGCVFVLAVNGCERRVQGICLVPSMFPSSGLRIDVCGTLLITGALVVLVLALKGCESRVHGICQVLSMLSSHCFVYGAA